MPNYVYIAQSLDGFIAGPNDELDWLDEIENPENSDFGFTDFMDGVDALLMGRKTFEKVLSFGSWPYEKPVFVASNTLSALPDLVEGKAFLIKGSAAELAQQLNKIGHKDLYIDGGLLIQDFLSAGLIDKMIITTIPVLLGAGIPLFGMLSNRVKLNLIESEVLVDQMVKTTYEVVKSYKRIK